MGFRKLLISTLVIAINIYEKTRRYLAWCFYPLAKIYVDKEFKRTGLKIVDRPVKGPNEIQILKDEKEFYLRMVENPFFGMASSKVDQLVDCNSPELIFNSLRNGNEKEGYDGITWLCRFFNLQQDEFAWEVADHYNTGNDLFQLMLDPYMQYSCGYWKDAKDLNTAQLNKMKLIAEKLKLKPGMTVLDLGCGFGGLAKYLAENYGVSVVGCTISEEQVKLGQKLCQGLPVKFELCDYQKMELDQKFDRIVSVGFMEHVGYHNYRTLYKIADRYMHDDGIFVLHTMGRNSSTSPGTCKWSHVYVFPNGWFPKLEDLIIQAEDLFVVEDVQNLGANYYPTLCAWEENFKKNWHKIENKYGDKFYRIWMTYLHGAQGILRSRTVHVYQMVYAKKGILGGYNAPR